MQQENNSVSVLGLKEQFSTLWLAATNPKKLSRDDIQDERLSSRCREIIRYLSPFFIVDLDDINNTTTTDGTGVLQNNTAANNTARCRVTLYVAVQLLFGLHVLFDKKVSLVQRQLTSILREVRIHLNLVSLGNQRNQQGTGARKRNLNKKSTTATGKLNSAAADDVQQNSNSLLGDMLVSQRRVSEMLDGAQKEDLVEYIDKIMANEEKAGFLDGDSILETLKNSHTLDDLMNFGDQNCQVETMKDLMQMSDVEGDFAAKKFQQKQIDFNIPDLDFTPVRNDVEMNDLPDNNFDKRSPVDVSAINMNDIKRRKLVYESILMDQKPQSKTPKKKSIQIDTPIDLSSQFIKNFLANTRDIVKKDKPNNYVMYHKQKLFFNTPSELDNYLKLGDDFFGMHFEEILHREVDETLIEEKKIADDVLQMRASVIDDASKNNHQNFNQNQQHFQSHHAQSKNFSDSSMRLRNNSQDSYMSNPMMRSKIEASPVYNQPPDLDFVDQNVDFPRDAEFKSTFTEPEIFRRDSGIDGDLLVFQDFYPPQSCTKKRVADAFYKLLRKASRKEVRVEQEQIMGRILIRN